MMKTPLKIIAPVAAILAFATALPASAGENDGMTYKTSPVEYSDLNLATEAGQKTLKKRIRHAVSKVCGVKGRVSVREQLASNKCKEVASRQAEQKARTAIARHTDGDRVANGFSPVVAGN